YSNQTKSSSATSVQSIIDHFLFGKKTVTNETNTSQQNEVINNAPETRLSSNLTGIVAVSNDDKAGVASIESQ
ncbi:type II secretion system protein N, partial [Pseudoalteromonas undina]